MTTPLAEDMGDEKAVMPLDRSQPLYLQVANTLSHRIATGHLSPPDPGFSSQHIDWEIGERLDHDPNGTRCGCFLPDLTGLAGRLPATTSRDCT